jgi:predicted LPLAT superfamily acyltransferase
MKVLFYKSLMALSRRTGIWIFIFFSWFIATGYFLFFPTRVVVSVRFYRALFPDKSGCYHLWCTWRQYHHFTYVFLDRFLLRDEQEITHISEGFDLLVEAVKKGKGAIVLMSHMGNWEVAASRMKHKGMKVLLYVGKKYKEEIERMQKDTLKREGVRIIAADQEGGSPFDIVEGIQFLREGGVVSMTGDRIWSADQRAVAVRLRSFPAHPSSFSSSSGWVTRNIRRSCCRPATSPHHPGPIGRRPSGNRPSGMPICWKTWSAATPANGTTSNPF